MDVAQLLREKGLSVTKNRIMILNCLVKDEHEHFHTISDISKHIGNINKKSIYNNIKLLIEAGLVDAVSLGGIVKYAINENVVHGGYDIHVVHDNGEIAHLELDHKIFQQIEKAVKKNGYKSASIKITVQAK